MSAHADIARDNAQRLGLFTLALGFSWLVFVIYALHASLPSNALHLPFEKAVHLKYLFPQHWPFFTSEPREVESVQFYRRLDEGGWELASTGPHFTLSNAFGLIRRGWAQGMEASNLMDQLPETSSQTCREETTACLEKTSIAAHLVNDYPKRTLCGDITFVSSKPVPWVWASAGTATYMPAKVSRAIVECP